MRFVVCVLLSVLCCGCEKKPSVEELEAQRGVETVSRATPTPKPGAWMWQDRKNPLEQGSRPAK
jgi:hypothetical protein